MQQMKGQRMRGSLFGKEYKGKSTLGRKGPVQLGAISQDTPETIEFFGAKKKGLWECRGSMKGVTLGALRKEEPLGIPCGLTSWCNSSISKFPLQ